MILHVVGARPNFMKASPLIEALNRRGTKQLLVHTGQHYDAKMSDVFFVELGLPQPDINLEVGSGSHAQQTAGIMTAIEPVLIKNRPEWLVVYGDVNSTIAAALVAVKLGIKIAHVEAGLRSFDPTMPEEINRVLTDRISDLLFTPSPDGDENLIREGVAKEKIHCVGNIMIDSLVRLLPVAAKREQAVMGAAGVGSKSYVLVTLHRPSNVDDPARLSEIMSQLEKISHEMDVVFPVHPRTLKMLEKMNVSDRFSRIKMIEPLGYLDFLALQKNAYAVVTDSGGVQEETSYLDVPCFTLRPNTERPITAMHGTNVLITGAVDRLDDMIKNPPRKNAARAYFTLWDGNTSGRIADILVKT